MILNNPAGSISVSFKEYQKKKNNKIPGADKNQNRTAETEGWRL